MIYSINRLYGILTDGDKIIRNTTTDRSSAPKESKQLLNALIPLTLSADSRRALAEFYLRLCSTDKSLLEKIAAYDPINSYALHTFYADYGDDLDLSEIVQKIKELGLPNSEHSFSEVDHIINALKQLLMTLVSDE